MCGRGVIVSMVTGCRLTQYEYGISENDLLSQLNIVTISRREVELVGVSTEIEYTEIEIMCVRRD